MSEITWSQWVQFAIVLLILISLGLTALSHLKFIAKSAAWSSIIAGAQRIVNQIVAVLEADPTASKADLIQKGVTELRGSFTEELSKLGINPAFLEPVLALVLQRLIAGSPTGLAQILKDVENAVVATTVSGASGVAGVIGQKPAPFRWSKHFNRDVGDLS
jgi:hypothetical protein